MKISIVLQALTGTFETDMRRASRETERSAKEMRKNFEEVGKVIGTGIAAVATASFALVKSTLDANDQLSKLSQKVGVATETLSALKYQAGLADVEIDALEKGMIKFNKSVGDAAGGTKLQAETFKALGITLKDQNGQLKTTDTLMLEVAEAFSKYRDGATKTKIAVDLFGRSGADLIPMLNEGAEGFREAYEEADQFGRIVSTQAGKASEQFNDNITRLTESVAGFGNQLTAHLLPALVAVSEEMVRSQKEGNAFTSVAEVLADAIKFLAQVVVVAKGVIEAFTNLIAAVVDSLIGFAEIGAGLFTNLGYAVSGLVKGMSGDLRGASEDFDMAGRALGAGWEAGFNRIRNGWSSATDGIQQAIDKSQKLYDAIDKPQKSVAERAEQFRNVISGVGPMLEKADAPIVNIGTSAAKAAGKIKEAADAMGDLGKMQAGLEQEVQNMQDRLGGATDAQIAYNNAIRDAAEAFNAAIAKGADAATAAEAYSNILALAGERMSLSGGGEQGNSFIADLNQQLEDAVAKLGMTERQMFSYQAGVDAVREAQKSLNAELLKTPGVLEKIRAEAAKKAGKLFDFRQIQSVLDQFNANKSPILQMVDQMKLLEEAIASGRDAFGNLLPDDQIERMKNALDGLHGQIASDMAGAFKALLGTAQQFTEKGSSGFKNLEKGMAALSIIQDILAIKAAVTAVLSQGASPPPMSFAAMAAMAAAVAPLLASIGLTMSAFGGGSFSDTAAQRQASQGTGSVLGDAEAKSESIANAVETTANATSELVGINRGMLNALHALQDALGAAGGQLARGAGDVDFSGLDLSTEGDLSIWEQNDLIGRLIGGSSDITDQGIIIFGGALNDLLENIAVGAYQEVQSQSSFFGSTHTNEGIIDVTDELGTQFQLVIGSIVDAVREGAEALGLLPADIQAALDAFAVEEIRISLLDLSAEEQQAELEAVFSEIFDGLAGSIVPFIGQFQQVGEGLGETLIRVATGVQVTQEAMRQLGLVIDETDPERFAQISEGLIHAVGSIDEFISGMQQFVDAFAPESHRFLIAQEALNSAFEQAGLTLPETSDAMWALMQSLDATTEQGQQQIATLIRLADVAAEYYDLLEGAVLDYLKLSGSLQEELGQSGGFAAARRGIEEWTLDTIRDLNNLAVAAGRAGASEQDLVNVHAVAAQRIAQLIAKLREGVQDLAQQLGYIGATDTLESLNAQIEAMGSASGDAADAIGSAIDSMRAKMDLLLGDLSPFNDQKKLELALEGLRAGTVDPQTVLEIGRRLFASTSNYTRLFEQVMGMAQFGQGANGPTGQGVSGDGRTLAELIAARDALLEAQRPELAGDLAHRLAELAFATGDGFDELAESMGFSLSQLGADLGLSGEQLQEYLESLREQFEAQDFGALGDQVESAITQSTDRIVEAITGKPIEAVQSADAQAESIASRMEQSEAEQNQQVIAAIESLKSALVSSGAFNTDRVVGSQEGVRRDLMDFVNGQAAGGGRIPEMVR